MAMVESRWH